MAESSAYIPTEILQLVFDEANDYDGVITASHVSQHWRLSARSHRLYTVDMSIQILSDSDIAGQLHSKIRLLLSAPLPLDLKLIVIAQGATIQLLLPELVDALACAMVSPGIRKLSFFADAAYLDTAMERLRDTPAPVLEMFSLIAELTRGTASLSRLFSYTPVLRDVTLINATIGSIGGSETSFASMRKMTIVSSSVDISFLLSACPALQHLTLHDCNLKPNAVSAPDSTQSDIHRTLRKLELSAVSSPLDETLDAVFRTIRLSTIPAVTWTSIPPPTSVIIQGLLDGLPPNGLVFSLSMTNDLRDLLVLGLRVQDTAPTSCLTSTIGARVREVTFPHRDDFTPWSWVGTHRIAHLRITHRLISSALQAVPEFCLPQLLELHIEAPDAFVSTAIDFWDPQQDLAQGRLLVPRLQRLNLFAGDKKLHANIVTAVGLASLATRVLGLSPVDADLAAATAATRPDLRLVGLRMDERGTELLRLFNKIEIEELNHR